MLFKFETICIIMSLTLTYATLVKLAFHAFVTHYYVLSSSDIILLKKHWTLLVIAQNNC